MSINDQIHNAISSVVDPMIEGGAAILVPNKIAGVVIATKYGSESECPMLRHHAANDVRREVRRYLSHMFEPDSKIDSDDQIDMFDGRLQDHYPAKRDGVRSYVRLEQLTVSEGAIISDRYRRAASSLNAHADALMEYLTSRDSKTETI